MCGKFTQMFSWREVHAQLSGFAKATADDKIVTVTPMRFASVLHLGANGQRKMSQMRWGFSKRSAGAPGRLALLAEPRRGLAKLSPSAARTRPDHIHARAETIDQLPTFRDAFAQRRGLLIVRTFNEGKELPSGKTEQHTITPNDGKPVAIAVIWGSIATAYGRKHEGGDELLTYVMITVPPNRLIATITDRMPAIIAEQDWGKWLGETPASQAELKSLLKTREVEATMQPENPDRTQDQPGLF